MCSVRICRCGGPGVMLDPVADKDLLGTMYVTLASLGMQSDFLAIQVVFCDLQGGVLRSDVASVWKAAHTR